MAELTINARILAMLEDVARTARMETAGFYLSKSGEHGLSNDEDTARIRAATRLWRESWIINPIERAIAAIRQTKFRAEITKTFIVQADSPGEAERQAYHLMAGSSGPNHTDTVKVSIVEGDDAS